MISDAVIKDIAQNVFMKLWLARHALSEEQSLDSYIFTLLTGVKTKCVG